MWLQPWTTSNLCWVNEYEYSEAIFANAPEFQIIPVLNEEFRRIYFNSGRNSVNLLHKMQQIQCNSSELKASCVRISSNGLYALFIVGHKFLWLSNTIKEWMILYVYWVWNQWSSITFQELNEKSHLFAAHKSK